MAEKLEVLVTTDGRWAVGPKDNPCAFTHFDDESDAHKFAAVDLLIEALELLSEMIGDTNELRAMLESLRPGVYKHIEAALAAARVPEGDDGH